ncbi:MAG: hypothetical protein QM778_01330 [Myxococcales bacterium]
MGGMRRTFARVLVGAVLLVGVAVPAQATAPAATLRVAEPRELQVGDRAALSVTLTLPAQAGAPLLLTQSVEGEALEVVRGRLLRSDARDPQASPLSFDVPVLARAPGTSIVRVHALIYLCDAQCEAVEIEQRVSVRVLAR